MPDVNRDDTPFCRVLVLDDEGGLQMLVRGVLESLDYMVEVASNGFEGLEKIQDDSFDIIVSDISMPGMGGLEFFDELKEIDDRQARRLLFVTGARLGKEQSQRLRATGQPVLRKPFDLQQFMDAVNEMRDSEGINES